MNQRQPSDGHHGNYLHKCDRDVFTEEHDSLIIISSFKIEKTVIRNLYKKNTILTALSCERGKHRMILGKSKIYTY